MQYCEAKDSEKHGGVTKGTELKVMKLKIKIYLKNNWFW